ncbi:MAG TPA: molybdopterin molybdotransferase MoeA [Tepidisphaeraceae bacterium]|jgi:molybdopterin molybdotransferase
MGELDLSQIISVAEAIRIIDSVPITQHVEDVPIRRAQGYTLAENVLADQDYPPFDKSLMDGFAVGSLDDAEYQIVGEIAAGAWPTDELHAGQAVAIMTGAPLPKGAACVVPVEYTEVAGDKLRVTSARSAGQNIGKQGSDIRQGQIVLCKGQQLEAAQLAVAATVGEVTLPVYRTCAVGILSTGDEVISPELMPRKGQIRDCNTIMLMSLMKRLQVQHFGEGHFPDQIPAITKALRAMLKSMDIVFITGGMSMGKYDFAPRVFADLGVKPLITKLRIKPGKPFFFGVTEDSRFVFGLPGNPVSGFVCTVRLASRLIRRLQGKSPEPKWIETKLLDSLPANGNREFYQPVKLEESGARPLSWKGSADIFTLAQANALLPRPENEPPLTAGQTVRVMAIA